MSISGPEWFSDEMYARRGFYFKALFILGSQRIYRARGSYPLKFKVTTVLEIEFALFEETLLVSMYFLS